MSIAVVFQRLCRILVELVQKYMIDSSIAEPERSASGAGEKVYAGRIVECFVRTQDLIISRVPFAIELAAKAMQLGKIEHTLLVFISR